MAMVTRKREGVFYSACLSLFLTRSSLVQFVRSCSGLFHFLKVTASQNVLTCKFTKPLQVRFYFKVEKAFLQSEETLMYYKVKQVSLQSGAIGIQKQVRYYKRLQFLLQSGSGITNWGNYYWVEQYNMSLNQLHISFVFRKMRITLF